MEEALTVEPSTPLMSIVETKEEGDAMAIESTDTDIESRTRWNFPAILAFNAVGAAAYKYGNDPNLLTPEMLTMKWGTYFPAGSSRHLVIGFGFAAVCEAGFMLFKQQHQKLKAFTLAQVPSIGYEFLQKFSAGHFGYGDIATAAAASGLHLVFSTRRSVASPTSGEQDIS